MERFKEFILRRRLVIYICLGVVLVSILAAATFIYFRHRDKQVACTGTLCDTSETATPVVSITPTPTATPLQAASRLNGVQVPVEKANLRPLAVMIENHPDARPQSGLGSADLVYEAIAEGGITRFMAVFGDASTPVRLGPIRSARTYYVDLAQELGAFYAHVGGNMDALDQIKATSNFRDMDQFGIGSPVYQRDLSRNVALEHTMYSSTEKLWAYATEKRSWSTDAEYESWKYGAETPLASRPASQSVSVQFSSVGFQVDWVYNPTTNSYSRNLATKPHIDANTNTQITAKTIIIQRVERRQTVTRINEAGWIYTLTGSGSAVIVQNGVTADVTWRKEGSGRTRYYNAANQEVALVPGTTWVEIVHPDTVVKAQ